MWTCFDKCHVFGMAPVRNENVCGGGRVRVVLQGGESPTYGPGDGCGGEGWLNKGGADPVRGIEIMDGAKESVLFEG
jgi:hypothetical protein